MSSPSGAVTSEEFGGKNYGIATSPATGVKVQRRSRCCCCYVARAVLSSLFARLDPARTPKSSDTCYRFDYSPLTFFIVVQAFLGCLVRISASIMWKAYDCAGKTALLLCGIVVDTRAFMHDIAAKNTSVPFAVDPYPLGAIYAGSTSPKCCSHWYWLPAVYDQLWQFCEHKGINA